MKHILLVFFTFFFLPAAFGQARVPEEVLQVSVGADATAEASDRNFDIYPNPSNGIIQLSLKGFSNKKTEIRVSNVIGNLVHKEVLQEPEKRYVKVLDLSNFAKGVYYVKLEADGFSEVRKVVIK